MKIKTIILLIILVIAITGCMRPPDIKCNYDGECENWETNDCVDCVDIIGRGVPIPDDIETDPDIVIPR
jgi:hypothetical protein